MKAISLHAPWATLVALGVKRYETRSWPAPASVIGQRVAIHQAVRQPDLGLDLGPWRVVDAGQRDPVLWNRDTGEQAVLPLGQVACTAIVGPSIRCGNATLDTGFIQLDAGLLDVQDQLPYGDFSPGRWAWELTDIDTTVTCPDCKGVGNIKALNADDLQPLCERCTGTGSLNLPVPAKGRQGLFRWEP
jgi:hypothetical protein